MITYKFHIPEKDKMKRHRYKIFSCPFCRSFDLFIKEDGIGCYAVCCGECSCLGPSAINRKGAVSFWNKNYVKRILEKKKRKDDGEDIK